ncbi:MAG: hypothetical protein Q7J11_00270, partial [Candidatus Roizmanbacteria bacterium]|nr:hypothetical protein [Candidatus Roizmanbacteria bacterium]
RRESRQNNVVKLFQMKKLKIIFMIIILVAIGYFVFMKWVGYSENPLTQAVIAHKFGSKVPYIIIKTDSSGASVEKSPPLVYVVILPGELNSAGALSGRRIGQSKVDLEKYINKKVYIDGEYYEGTPLLINKPAQDRYGVTITQPVIRINKLTLIK